VRNVWQQILTEDWLIYGFSNRLFDIRGRRSCGGIEMGLSIEEDVEFESRSRQRWRFSPRFAFIPVPITSRQQRTNAEKE
jgi:hypothetical protein